MGDRERDERDRGSQAADRQGRGRPRLGAFHAPLPSPGTREAAPSYAPHVAVYRARLMGWSSLSVGGADEGGGA